MTEIENKITNLLNPTQNYVVALSGGVDSCVCGSNFVII